jgi:hypothetical protein
MLYTFERSAFAVRYKGGNYLYQFTCQNNKYM